MLQEPLTNDKGCYYILRRTPDTYCNLTTKLSASVNSKPCNDFHKGTLFYTMGFDDEDIKASYWKRHLRLAQ